MSTSVKRLVTAAGLFVALGALSAVPSSAAPELAPNLVENGSFEIGFPDPPSGPWWQEVGYAGQPDSMIPGWTETADGVDWHANIEIDNEPAAQDGSYLVELYGGGHGALEQAVPTAAGARYLLEFFYAAHPGCGDSTGMARITAGDASVDVESSGTNTYASQTLPFTATGASTTITFASIDGGSCPWGGVTIDDISVRAVARATPALATQASAGIVLGAGELSAAATVSGRSGAQPDATVTFTLYGPDDATCAGTPLLATAPAPYPAGGGPVTSASFTPAQAGTYRWIAAYSGDVNNAPVSGACDDPAAATTVTAAAAAAAVTPAPTTTPPPVATPASAPGCDRLTSKLWLARASIDRSERTISILAPITRSASGAVTVSLRAAGETTEFSAPIDSHNGRIRVTHPITAAQARLGRGIVTIAYDGDADTRPQTVRLPAANTPARLEVTRPQISADGVLSASGTVSPSARGVVRVQLHFVNHADGAIVAFERTATIADGRWSITAPLSPSLRAQIAQRCGTVHSYTSFSGGGRDRLRGEMRALQVLPAA